MAIKIFIDQGHNPSGPEHRARRGTALSSRTLPTPSGSISRSFSAPDPRFEVRLSRNAPGRNPRHEQRDQPRCPRTGGERLAGGLLHQYSLQRE